METGNTSQLRVLVAAGDRFAASDLRCTVERLGHAVSGPAATGAAALRLAEGRLPDVALVDVRLPDGGKGPDGIALAAVLRRRLGVPVLLVVSGSGLAGERGWLERAMLAAPAGYLKRPFTDAEVAASLAAAQERGLSPQNDAFSATRALPPPMRDAALARAAELSRQPSFRELLGPRGSSAEPAAGIFFDDADDGDDALAIDLVSPLDEIGDPVLTIDSQFRIVAANARALVFFGGAAPLIGRDFWADYDPAARTRHETSFRLAAESEEGRSRFELRDTARDRWLEVSAYRSQSAGFGESPGWLALFRDITARKRSEAETVRHHRLEGLGLLGRGFAHDFNNLLTVLIGSLDLASEPTIGDDSYREELTNATRAANDARDLVQQLLTFAQGGSPVREELRLADLIRGVLNDRRQAHPLIRYQFQSADPALRALVDRRQITRLIENLVTNAEQAMSRGGALIARCQKWSGSEVSRLKNGHDTESEDHLAIEIIDTGRGMTEEELEHAFDPFYTTRGGSNATGIGLTVCESIAKAHGGFIFLQSKEGRGTIATFCVPIRQIAPSASPFMPPSAVPGRDNVFMPRIADSGLAAEDDPSLTTEVGNTMRAEGGRILILEDDDLIRRLIAVTLRRDGHEVVETADGHDTVRCYREAKDAGQTFDLVLSDLTIEDGLGGVETMRQLIEIDPAVLAIVSSGYSDAPAMSRPEAYGFSAVLPKPYPPRELRSLVAEMLRRRRRGEPAASVPPPAQPAT
jgi:two-component system cell cycle sensor histidine kinase/response regulator CckA